MISDNEIAQADNVKLWGEIFRVDQRIAYHRQDHRRAVIQRDAAVATLNAAETRFAAEMLYMWEILASKWDLIEILKEEIRYLSFGSCSLKRSRENPPDDDTAPSRRLEDDPHYTGKRYGSKRPCCHCIRTYEEQHCPLHVHAMYQPAPRHHVPQCWFE